MNNFDGMSKEELNTPQVFVEEREGKSDEYIIWYGFISPFSKRRQVLHFTFKPGTDTGFDKEKVKDLAEEVIQQYPPSALTRRKGVKSKICARDLQVIVYAKARAIKTGHRLGSYLKLADEPECSLTKEDMYTGTKDKTQFYIDPSILHRETEDSGKTIFMAGRSFSGKTTLVVKELNKLEGMSRGGDDVNVADRGMYEKIIVMTSSPNALPWKNLSSELEITIIPLFSKRIVAILKILNDVTNNKLPFLIVLDDVFSEMQGSMFKRLILTMRNSNISSVALSQYLKHASPQVRNSFHMILITKFKAEEWLYYISSTLQNDVEEMMGVKHCTLTLRQLANTFGTWVGSDIVVHNVREDKLNLIQRDKF